MSIQILNSGLQIEADAIATLALAALLLLLGAAVKNRVRILNHYCIPAPVVGGFLFMFLTFLGHVTGSFQVSFDTYFQSPFMLAFFTTVGLSASFSLLKRGGIMLVVYWLISGVISVIQNAIGIAVGTAIGLPAPYALLSSAISMIGGHGAAASYGAQFTEMGYDQAMLVGAAATNSRRTGTTVSRAAMSLRSTRAAARRGARTSSWKMSRCSWSAWRSARRFRR